MDNAGETTPKKAEAAKLQGLEDNAAYTQLQAFLAQFEPNAQGKLPPERELCEALGVSRGALRKALARAESQGRIWRHVGKGTFFGPRPAEDSSDQPGIAEVASRWRFCAPGPCWSRCWPRRPRCMRRQAI